MKPSLIAASCLFVLTSSIPAHSKPPGGNLWVICYGTNFSEHGITHKPLLTNHHYYYRTAEDKPKILKIVTDKWAQNEPADTWGCRGFDENIDSEWADYVKFGDSLHRQGYDEYIGLEGNDPRIVGPDDLLKLSKR